MLSFYLALTDDGFMWLVFPLPQPPWLAVGLVRQCIVMGSTLLCLILPYIMEKAAFALVPAQKEKL